MKAWQVTRHGDPGTSWSSPRCPRPDARPRTAPGPGARRRGELPRRADDRRDLPGPPAAAVHPGRRAVRRGRAGRPGDGFGAGDRVIGGTALPHGGFAEYALMPSGAVMPAPAALDDAEAAPFHVTYQTGWFGLHRRAHLQPGETLLVHAAAGGVGSGAVQLGKAAGRARHRRGRRPGEGRGGPGTRRGRGHRPARRGLRGGRQGGHRRPGRRRRLRLGGRRRLPPLHQVHRVRGPDRGRRLRQRRHPVGRAQPRPGEELLDPRPALGPVPAAQPGRDPRLPRRADPAGRRGHDQAADQRAADRWPTSPTACAASAPAPPPAASSSSP